MADPIRAGGQAQAQLPGRGGIACYRSEPDIRTQRLAEGTDQRPAVGVVGNRRMVGRVGQQGEVVVHDHHDVRMPGQQTRQCACPFVAQVAAGGIVRPRRDDDGLRAFGQSRLQPVGLHALRIDRNADGLKPDGPQ
ncbi:hypothetical protein G6F57_022099 [Rhizopus arrhizus]|nr:hypothetical protein G6F57_022099 [Rhizopus arrhizus]